MSKAKIQAVNDAAPAVMAKLPQRPSREAKRAYKLQHFSLSELVSDLWWVSKTATNSKGLKEGK